MKIKTLQISNILSFQHFADIASAEKITFEDGLNIIIGENGAGKSTALEVINFLFKRVVYKQFNVNQEIYSRKGRATFDERKQILLPVNTQSFSGFRLDPNWNTENETQTIRLEVNLDDIDKENIKNLLTNADKLKAFALTYTTRGATGLLTYADTYVLDITLDRITNNFAVTLQGGASDFGYEYLSDYNFYRELIAMYNLENPTEQISPLYESFTLISSYRNYQDFTTSITLREQHPAQQMQTIRSQTFAKSLNTIDQSEPAIFNLVRLRVAEKHFSLYPEKMSESEREKEANALPFIDSINKKLKVVNLECKIRLIDARTWQYTFEFFDTLRSKKLTDINSLSAGQKAIIHLVFEAYGRGDLKGGLVIIDEPEIHLHYQFQNEYLQVIRDLNKEQNCQYILVTHSEALINSSTINQVKRFSLNKSRYTEIKAPTLTTDEKTLIKILDNTRSTYAFFSKKVILVEGDSDRYFIKSIIKEKYPQLDQEIAVLYISGKNEYTKWKSLFESFGLEVYFITDLDFAYNLFYPTEPKVKLNTAPAIATFKSAHTDVETRIGSEYPNKIFILKNGDLEHYLGIRKDLAEVIFFCNTKLAAYLADDTNPESLEVREIVKQTTL